MNDILSEYYGNITAQVLFKNLTAQEATGDMHIMVTSFSEGLVSVLLCIPVFDLAPLY